MAGKGKINRPVNLKNVYTFFGLKAVGGCFDIGYICSNRHGKVNKASKVKPIRYDAVKPLTASQFAGTMADQSNGIRYGMRCMLHQGGTEGSTDASRGWSGLHKCDWTYLPPIPGTHYGRLSDFDGYNDDAVFNPIGAVGGVRKSDGVDAVMYYDIPENLLCDVICENSNGSFVTSNGVNLQEVAGVSDIGTWYPCILISDVNSAGEPIAPHYVRALAETRLNVTEAKKYQPLKDEYGVWYGNYLAETYTDVDKQTVQGGLNINSACKKMVTLFIAQSLGTSSSTDWRQWRQVTDSGLPTGYIYTVPEAAGIIVDYRRAYAQGLKYASASAKVENSRIHVVVIPEFVKEDNGNVPDRSFTYSMAAVVYRKTTSGSTVNLTEVGSGTYSISGKWAYPEEVSGEPLPAAQLDIQTSLLTAAAHGNYTFEIHWTVRSDMTGTRVLNSGTNTITYSY